MKKPTQVTTGLVRFSFPHLFEPYSGGEGQTAKYSMCLLIPKKDKETVRKINRAIAAAEKLGVSEKWGGKKPKNLKNPLRDGDEEKDGAEFEGMYFINASGNMKPGTFDRNNDEIINEDEIYAGAWGQVSLNMFPYKASGNVGVGAGLQAVKMIKDGEPLGGVKVDPNATFGDADDFDDDYDDEDDDIYA